MLFLLFQLGSERYALQASQIVEVLPLVNLKRIPQSPKGLAGAFSYRGAPVPVIDLSELLIGQPAERRLSTRIILVRQPAGAGESRKIGLIAERATETAKLEKSEFTDLGLTGEGAQRLGPVAFDSRGLLQWVEVDKLVPVSLRDSLLHQVQEAA